MYKRAVVRQRYFSDREEIMQITTFRFQFLGDGIITAQLPIVPLFRNLI